MKKSPIGAYFDVILVLKANSSLIFHQLASYVLWLSHEPSYRITVNRVISKPPNGHNYVDL